MLEAAGFETDDPIAAAYCEANPCDPCSNNQPDCWKVEFQARDVHFKNNIVHSPDLYAIRAYSAALEGFEAANNLYYSPDGDVEFRVDGDTYTLASFPYETDSQEIDPGLMDVTTYDLSLRADSAAIDSAADLGVATDFLGLPRDAAPDIGAYEYGAGSDDDDDSGGDDDDTTDDDDDSGCRLAPPLTPLGPATGWLLAALFIWSCRRRAYRSDKQLNAISPVLGGTLLELEPPRKPQRQGLTPQESESREGWGIHPEGGVGRTLRAPSSSAPTSWTRG